MNTKAKLSTNVQIVEQKKLLSKDKQPQLILVVGREKTVIDSWKMLGKSGYFTYEIDGQTYLASCHNGGVVMKVKRINQYSDAVVFSDDQNSFIYGYGVLSPSFKQVITPKDALSQPLHTLKLFPCGKAAVVGTYGESYFIGTDMKHADDALYKLIIYTYPDVKSSPKMPGIALVETNEFPKSGYVDQDGFVGDGVHFRYPQGNILTGDFHGSATLPKGVAAVYRYPQGKAVPYLRDLTGQVIPLDAEKEDIEYFIKRAQELYAFQFEGKKIEDIDSSFFKDEVFADAVYKYIPFRLLLSEVNPKKDVDKKAFITMVTEMIVSSENDAKTLATKFENNFSIPAERALKIARQIYSDYAAVYAKEEIANFNSEDERF